MLLYFGTEWLHILGRLHLSPPDFSENASKVLFVRYGQPQPPLGSEKMEP